MHPSREQPLTTSTPTLTNRSTGKVATPHSKPNPDRVKRSRRLAREWAALLVAGAMFVVMLWIATHP